MRLYRDSQQTWSHPLGVLGGFGSVRTISEIRMHVWDLAKRGDRSQLRALEAAHVARYWSTSADIEALNILRDEPCIRRPCIEDCTYVLRADCDVGFEVCVGSVSRYEQRNNVLRHRVSGGTCLMGRECSSPSTEHGNCGQTQELHSVRGYEILWSISSCQCRAWPFILQSEFGYTHIVDLLDRGPVDHSQPLIQHHTRWVRSLPSVPLMTFGKVVKLLLQAHCS